MRYKLELEFESNLPEDLVTRQIEKHIDSAMNVCLSEVEVDYSSVKIHTNETITIPKEAYTDLVRAANYVYHWGNRPMTCKKCGNLNPSHCICASCGYDGSDEI